MAQATKKRATSAKRKKTSAKRVSSSVSSSKATASKSAAALQRTVAARKSSAQSRTAAAASLSNSAAIGQMQRMFREVGGIVCVFAAILVLLALVTFNVNDPGWSHTGTSAKVANSVGRAGAWFADVAFYLFGFMAFLLPLVLTASGWLLFRDEKRSPQAYRPFAFIRVIGIVLMLLTASGLADLHFSVPDGALPKGTFGGGILGTEVAWRLVSFLHPLGTTLLLLALFFSSMTMAFGTSWLQLVEKMGELVLYAFGYLRSLFSKFGEAASERAKVRAAAQARKERSRSTRYESVELPTDPLLDGSGPSPIKTGLAAALEAARNKAKQGSAAAISAAKQLSDSSANGSTGSQALARNASELDARLDDALKERDASNQGSPAKQALARANALAAKADAVASSADSEAEQSAAKATSLAAAAALAASSAAASSAAASSAARKKKIAIKQRLPEQKQTKLILDDVDSELPPISLLDAPEPQTPGFSEVELEAISRLLEEKLAEFRITVEVVAVHPGPVITRFEMQLAPGIKASRITGLSQDLARSLSLVSVRVVEVIPGKSTIGIEVPNEHREIVQLSEIIQSDEYNGNKSKLTLALGKDISGQPITADLGKMPHLLVAGTTGSGKSVGVNSMLVSLLYKATPNDVRLILIDPKMLELNVYDGIPHLLTPVVTDMKEAANALRWCVGEMERRYTLMAELKVRNITGFNKKVHDAEKAGTPIVDPLYKAELSLEPTAAPPTLEHMPFIVVVVDEFADMMMQVGKKAEEMIARIAQKARAAGIHLILATQRPSVDVITGLIKANVPTRIAFQVSQKVDSRTILDQGGAESLLGHGDMLYLPPGTAVPIRVHGAFVDDHEVNNIASHIRSTGEPSYIEEILQESTAAIPGLSPSDDSAGEQDALYDQAVAVVTESRKASISYVQRRLKIGYNRAARMVEEMEAAGVVSQVGHNGTREVLAPPPI